MEGKIAKVSKGGHIGGSAPFGYRIQGEGREAWLVKVPAEQAALRTIEALRGKMSLREIAAAVKAKHQVKMSHEAVRRIYATTR